MPDMCYYLTGAPQPVPGILKMKSTEGILELSTREYQVHKAPRGIRLMESPCITERAQKQSRRAFGGGRLQG